MSLQTKAIQSSTLILRLTLAVILLMHSVPGMFSGGIHDFGRLYLDSLGFAPFGLAIAWAVKLSHVACAVLLILNRYIKSTALITIFILVPGIIMVHGREGWFVVGGGFNGVEYNVLLISVFLYLFFYREKKQVSLITRNATQKYKLRFDSVCGFLKVINIL